jgi:3-phenylpropionate/trans-cinnamate dioxygenase ferredoxin reductase subunit
MPKRHCVSQAGTGETFLARSGQILLDAALLAGTPLPHDCRAGLCGSCLTRIRAGITLGGESSQPGMVYACQARVFSSVTIEVEDRPPVIETTGKVTRLVQVAEGIVEVTIAPSAPLTILPGQYGRFRFRGYPARPFSPTAPLNGIHMDGRIRLNIKRVRNGRVTQELGRAIDVGHSVEIEGPHGLAFLRPGQVGRLVLVGSGTGFAPVWAVAAAALRENPMRPIVMVAASRKRTAFYMGKALDILARFPRVHVKAIIDELVGPDRMLLAGPAIVHLPDLTDQDIVHAAGAPKLVEAIGERAREAGAEFFADPFETATAPRTGWVDSAKAWLMTG